MRFRDMGVQLQYDSDFVIDREDGISRYGKPDYLFLYFHTECGVVLNGKEVLVRPPAVLIFDIGAKQHYYATQETYMDDYIHFWFDESRSFVDELNLPLNTVIPLPQNTVVPTLLRRMYEEFISMNEYKDQTMEFLFRIVLIKVAEMSERSKFEQIPDRYDELFQNLRSAIYVEPAKNWHVSDCAAQNGLSTPYFQKLYKAYFGNTFVQIIPLRRLLPCAVITMKLFL